MNIQFTVPITLTKVVFPEYCRPTSVSSISSFQKRLLNQSRTLLRKENMLAIGRVGRRGDNVDGRVECGGFRRRNGSLQSRQRGSLWCSSWENRNYPTQTERGVRRSRDPLSPRRCLVCRVQVRDGGSYKSFFVTFIFKCSKDNLSFFDFFLTVKSANTERVW